MKTILFDLDGTLLPMDHMAFANAVGAGIIGELCRLGYREREAGAAFGAAVEGVLKNDGHCTNEALFLSILEGLLGPRIREDVAALLAYYQGDFHKVKATCRKEPRARLLLDRIHEAGVPAVLATSPLFPRVATLSRVAWAGLCREDFLFITTYEDHSFCKPSLGYYREVLARIDAAPEECLMIGNDATEDMVARELGMEVFLLTDCLLNRHGVDITAFPRGSWEELSSTIDAFLA